MRKSKMSLQKGILIILIFIPFLFSGCGALHTAIKKSELDVQTRMSNSVFLEPVSLDKQVVYVRVRNTTDKEIDIQQDLKDAFAKNGFKITNNPDEAQFLIQANLLQIGKGDATTASRALQSGFGGAVLGAGVGAVAGNSAGAAAGGIIGGLVGAITDAMVDDVYFTMITDVEIRQRAQEGEIIETSTSSNVGSDSNANSQSGHNSTGISSNTNATNIVSVKQNIKTTNSQWKIYRTRVVSTANQVNLEFEEAEPELKKGLTRSLSGLL